MVGVPGHWKLRYRLFLFLGGLKTGVSRTGELAPETLDATGRVKVFQLASIERVTRATNIDNQFCTCAAGDETIAATTGDFGIDVIGMNIVLHRSLPQSTP